MLNRYTTGPRIKAEGPATNGFYRGTGRLVNVFEGLQVAGGWFYDSTPAATKAASSFEAL